MSILLTFLICMQSQVQNQPENLSSTDFRPMSTPVFSLLPPVSSDLIRFEVDLDLKNQTVGKAQELIQQYSGNEVVLQKRLVKKHLVDFVYGIKDFKMPLSILEDEWLDKLIDRVLSVDDTGGERKPTAEFIRPVKQVSARSPATATMRLENRPTTQYIFRSAPQYTPVYRSQLPAYVPQYQIQTPMQYQYPTWGSFNSGGCPGGVCP